MRKLSLMFIAMLILVVMVFAATNGTALGQGKSDTAPKGGKACGGGGIEAKAGGVVAKAPCE